MSDQCVARERPGVASSDPSASNLTLALPNLQLALCNSSSGSSQRHVDPYKTMIRYVDQLVARLFRGRPEDGRVNNLQVL